VTVPTVPADPSPRDRESLAWLTGTAGPTVPIHHALVGELAGCSRSGVDRHADERVVELAAAVHSLLTDSLLTCFDYTVFYEAVDAGGVAVPWVGSVPRAATGAQLRGRLTPLWHPPAGSAGEPAVEPPGETAWLGVTIAPTDIHLSTFDSLVAEVESVFGARLDDRSGELACFPDPEFEDSQRLLLLQFTPA
jgi:hypothetical protein